MSYAIVMDCGATNIRVIAVDQHARIIAQHSIKNNTAPDPNDPSLLIWDIEEIWQKLCACSQKVMREIDTSQIIGVGVSTFGVDGAPVDKNGKLVYPIISWQCARTNPIMKGIDKYIPMEELYLENGVYPFGFNTINKLIWLKENRPDVLDKMDYFLFISSILVQKLSGELVTESTMLGTSMLTNLDHQRVSTKIMDCIGFDASIFPQEAPAGTVVGRVREEASAVSGIPVGVKVVSAGHDTQFAVLGSGSDASTPVLSSGTWEILMTRTSLSSVSKEMLQKGILNEFDVVPKMYNRGCQWIASGLMEWVLRSFYSDIYGTPNMYETIISEATNRYPHFDVAFSGDFNPASIGLEQGSIHNLKLNTPREEVYLGALDYLCQCAKKGLNELQSLSNIQYDGLICVGGGSKNALWNQMRANTLGLPIKMVKQKETTVLGVVMTIFTALGEFGSLDEAKQQMVQFEERVFQPRSLCVKLDEIIM